MYMTSEAVAMSFRLMFLVLHSYAVTLMHGAVQARLRTLRDPVTSEVRRSCYRQVQYSLNICLLKKITYQYLIF
jgi:hypothetical protein